jgi:hypothetical protein
MDDFGIKVVLYEKTNMLQRIKLNPVVIEDIEELTF